MINANNDEFIELARAAGVFARELLVGKRSTPHPKYFIGTGKLEELEFKIREHSVDLVIFNNNLSPSQERDLESALSCRVLDKTGLILDIFAQRALTHEGKLQVELAQLKHLSTRLIRGWTHLKRQKGGIGVRGPGETQLESDRRLVQARILTLEKKLKKVANQRSQGRNRRKKSGTPLVSLVGYTNAGKSTIFNSLTSSNVFAKDMLFSTLDPTLRMKTLDKFGDVIFSDTVGFIRDLPHGLVKAFNSTLEEVSSADLILHVVDSSKEDLDDEILQVNSVLSEIGANMIPRLFIYNKCDLIDEPKFIVNRNLEGDPTLVKMSAKVKEHFDKLLEVISEKLSFDHVITVLNLSSNDLYLRSLLYDMRSVLNEKHLDDGSVELKVRMSEHKLKSVIKRYK